MYYIKGIISKLNYGSPLSEAAVSESAYSQESLLVVMAADNL